MKEAQVLPLVRVAMAKHGFVLFRNQLGAYNEGPRVIRYGLCNPGGSDLIGWRSVVITPEMVGKTIAQFAAIECKGTGGTLSSQQKNFIETVERAGGTTRVIGPAELEDL